MPLYRFSLFCLAVTFLGLMAPRVEAQIEVRIEPESRTFVAHSPVNVKVTLINRSARDLSMVGPSPTASWLNFRNKGDLALLFEGDARLFNQYAFLPVAQDRHPHVRADLAARLEAWLTSDRAASLINGYTIEDQPLFTFNADTVE